jgi:hypothetical protein
VIYRRLGKLPLEVGASWLARTAVAALGLLDELRQASGRPIPLAWAPGEAESWRVVEVYPAATRITHGMPDESGSIVGLSDVLDCSAVADVVTWSKDAGDACVCALAGADFLAGRAVPPEDVPTAHREGWIWAPDVQSPPRRTVVSSDSPEDRLPEADPVDSPERTPSPAGPASGEPACLACARGLPPTLPRVCPECHHVFRGNGWDGIDAHWKAKHEDVMPYRAFWDSLCADHKHGVRSQGRAFA